MIYRPYGTTGHEVSAIGFGGMRFRDQKDVEGCAALVKYAYDKGINYFDTAIGYGESEALFGVALKEMVKTRSERPFYISTKSMKANPEDIRRQCEASLSRLGLDSIDFYHVWCILDWAAYETRKLAGALKEFERLKEEGLVKNIVVSSHMTGADIGRLLEDDPFEGVLMGYSAMNFAYREAALATAERLKRGVVVMNPLGGGLIPEHPDKFGFLKTRPDQSVVQGALAFLLSDPRITISLVGFSDTDQVDEALGAVEGFTSLTSEQIAGIRSQLKENFNAMCTGCQYCDHCPQGMPVPKLMDAYNQYMLSDSTDALVNRLRWHWGMQPDSELLRSCVGCGLCERECTQKLPIIERIEALVGHADGFLAKHRK